MQLPDSTSLHAKAMKGRLIPTRGKTESAPLSFAQMQMWLMDQMEPGNPAYGLPVAYRLQGPLDVPALEKSFNEIIRRHEVLRTTFMAEDGEPRQVIHHECEIKILITRLDAVAPNQRESRLHVLATQEACVPFDLFRLPLIRVCLFKMSEEEHVLLMNLHHIVGDGISLRLILSELDKHYQGFAGSRKHDLPDLDIQYADFAAWQREVVAAKSFDREITSWRQELDGPLPVLELPADRQRPAVASFKGSNIFFEIPKTLAEDLAALGAREGCSLFTTLLAAFQVLLHRYSGADDMVIGTPVSMRVPAEVDSLIGNFLNMIPLRCDLSGDPTFLRVLRRARGTTLHAFSKASLPFEKIVENLSFQRDPSRNPIFQVMFELLPNMTPQIGSLRVSSFHFDPGYAQFDLSLHAWEGDNGYACRFEFCSDLFQADTIRRMSRSYLHLLSSVAENPNQRIAIIPILPDSEKKQLLVDWNRTSQRFPTDKSLHHLFEIAVTGNANRVAIECGEQRLTYEALNERANRLANYLIESGVKSGELVGICMGRSLDLVIGLLGILKAGAAYVPLDPSFPPERLAYMMEDAEISIVVTRTDLLETLPRKSRAICLDSEGLAILEKSSSNPGIPLPSSNLAYTIYTSGSSGQPKGVMIEHRSLVNCLCAMQREPGFGSSDVMVAVTTISFDIAALEIFLPLISGGRLVMASKSQTTDGASLAQLMRRSQATMLQATPVTWKLLIEADWKPASGFKMLCGGEALPRELANQLLERGGELWNMYGPTETTIWSSVHRVQSTAGPVPIGPPIANTQFYIVDKELQPVPVGVPGELLIGGDGLARGYWNRLDLTADRFLRNPSSCSETRVYRTGDMARFRGDGSIDFLGRRDFQVKVRGYRIELEEIEHVLAQHKSVKDVVVVTWEQDGDKRLVAYYIGWAGQKPGIGDLRRHLLEKLPEYMCPSFFIELPAFPLTPNGKVDRKAFPAPDLTTGETGTQPARPQRQVETKLMGIFQEILKRKTIGLDDNFFGLGGHSLLAARLFVQIEKKLGVQLPLATLFQAPTIRTLADRIEEKVKTPNWNSLVPIHAQGSKPPLFLVHGAEGNVLLYRNLAESLGPDQPVYGLQSQGLSGGEMFEPRIESIAAKYVEEIQSVQPAGPYYLGGYCVGGTIAFEIAQQLRRAGHTVALLALFETYNLKSGPPLSFILRMIHKTQNVYFQAVNLLLAGISVRFFAEKLRMEIDRFKVHCDILRERIVERFRSRRSAIYPHLRIRDANHLALEAYQPVPYDGRVMLLRPKVHFRKFDDPCFGWKLLAMQGVDVVEMPNYPRGSLNHPFVKVLAQRLRKEIERTLQDRARRPTLMLVPERVSEAHLVG